VTGGVAEGDAVQMWAAVLCAGLGAWALIGRDPALRRARLLFAGGGSIALRESGPPYPLGELVRRGWVWWRERFGRRLGREVLCLPVGGALALVGDSVLPLLIAVAAVPGVRRWLRRRECRRDCERGAAEVIELCGAVAGELRAGRQPSEALQAAVKGSLGAQASVLAAARFGGDVPGALRQAARQPGAAGLLGVAACWQAAADSGAGLAAGLDRVAAALRAERSQREDLQAQLAGTRSTAVLLALLPVFGLLMGGALGAEPLRVLLHTPAGLACLGFGGALECAGVALTARVVRAATGPAESVAW
jgi:tight adherence protein B